jgi:hypothetical protein
MRRPPALEQVFTGGAFREQAVEAARPATECHASNSISETCMVFATLVRAVTIAFQLPTASQRSTIVSVNYQAIPR